jgi:hypothetical protein
MIGFIQTGYITILNVIYKATGKINEKIRNAILWCFIFLLISLSIYNYAIWSRGASIVQFERDIIGCFFLAGIAIFSINGNLKKYPWNRQFVFIWYVFAILLFISGLLHSVENSYWLWSVSMLAGFPGFYLIWQNRKDYDTLFKLISSAMLVAMFIFFVICLYTVNSEMNVSGRFSSVMRNPNHLGKLAVSGTTAAFYLAITSKRMWLYGISVGIGWKLAQLSGSRAAIIVFIAQVIVFLVYYIKYMYQIKGFREIIGNLIFLICVSALCSGGAEKGIEYYQKQHDAIIIQEKEDAESEKKESEENIQVTESNQPTEETDNNPPEISQIPVEQNEDVLKDRSDIKGKTVDQISSGRTIIWKYYIKNLNFKGNDWKKYKANTPEYYYQWAHNDIIEISYRSGIFAGIFDFIFLFYLGIYILKYVFLKKEIKPYVCFTSLCILTYGGYAMLDVISFPFSMQYTFMFFVSLMPVFERRNELWTKQKSQ